MHDSGWAMQYSGAIAANFDSLGQIAALYVKDGQLDLQFFEDVRIRISGAGGSLRSGSGSLVPPGAATGFTHGLHVQ